MGPVVLDISRTVSRAARGRVTGIDRVERAYIAHFLEWPEPVAFVCKTRNRTAVLDRAGMEEFLALAASGGPWDRPDFWRLSQSADRKNLSAVFATVRRLARGTLPKSFVYLNVGHSNLDRGFLDSMRKAGASRLVVLVHDMIPLDFPGFCRAETTGKFATRMRAVTSCADLVICNSEQTAQRLDFWARKWGCADIRRQVIPLGTDPLPARPRAASGHPAFVVLGTIEPRKNHRLLLNIWSRFARDLPPESIPHLHIVGNRGWMNADVFKVLDTANFMGQTVFEHGPLPDEQVARLLAEARALLFPSFAEGFGYPAIEALQSGTPVLAAPLASLQEVVCKGITYIEPEDEAGWSDAILTLSSEAPMTVSPQDFPDWDNHFHNVATVLSDKYGGKDC